MGQEFCQSRIVESSFGFGRGILLLEDCEGYIKWTKGGTGGDDVLTFSNVAAFRGSYGMRLKTRVTGAAAADAISAYRELGWPESGRLVFRCRMAAVSLAEISYMNMQVAVGNGTRLYQSSLYFFPNTGVVQRGDSAGGLTTIASMAQLIYPNQWVPFEVVLDLVGFTYLSACINGLRANLAGLGMYDSSAVTYRFVRVTVQAMTSGAAPAEIYADDLYVGEYLV